MIALPKRIAIANQFKKTMEEPLGFMEELNLLHSRANAKLHINRKPGWYEESKKRWKEYHEFSDRVISLLSLEGEAIGCDNPFNNHQGMSYGVTHYVLKQSVKNKRFSREKGDALCKPSSKFNGNLWVKYCDHVTCKECLRRAIKLYLTTPKRGARSPYPKESRPIDNKKELSND